MSPTNLGMDPGFGPRPHAGRPGQMTAVMGSVGRAAGARVLRVARVVGGCIVEERIVEPGASVTVGPDEKATFVVQEGGLPRQFKLFERVRDGYCLNFLDAMSGRVAWAGGVGDLPLLRRRAKRIGSMFRVPLTEAGRGKIVIGETTFLFQFVVPPPARPRPRLPLSVKGGFASEIDWTLAILIALSFLFHFGLVGAMYSDWSDAVVSDDVTASLLDSWVHAPPLPVDTAEPAPDATARTPTAVATQRSQEPGPAARDRPPISAAPNARTVAQLLKEAADARIAIVGGLRGGPSIDRALSDGSGADVDLNELATRPGGFTNKEGLLSGVSPGGPIQPGRVGDWAGIRGHPTGGAPSVAGSATPVLPNFDMHELPPTVTAPVANVEAVIHKMIEPGARLCYQRGLQSNPGQAGKVVIVLKIAASGEVDLASVASNAGLSAQVASCIASVARRARFDPPDGTGATLSVPFNFVLQRL
jgi:hypothetical protein